MAELVKKYLDPDAYSVCLGAIPETTEILKLKWNHIFYTGNTNGGRIVAEAAAKHVTPVTLELGSQSPVFVDAATLSSAELEVAARRTLWGKQYNCGQVKPTANAMWTAVDWAMIFRSASLQTTSSSKRSTKPRLLRHSRKHTTLSGRKVH